MSDRHADFSLFKAYSTSDPCGQPIKLKTDKSARSDPGKWRNLWDHLAMGQAQ